MIPDGATEAAGPKMSARLSAEFPPRRPPSLISFRGVGEEGEKRLEYGSQLELILTLVSYAVGLGNLWRFPYLVYENGGGTFLIPYIVALLLLGIPMFILELGLGQMFRQGTVNMWVRLGMPGLRGAGVAATWTTFMAAIYYLVIVAWTIFMLGQIGGSVASGILPWEDHPTRLPNGLCPETVLIVEKDLINKDDLFDNETRLFNPLYREKFFCPLDPDSGIATLPKSVTEFDESKYAMLSEIPKRCPGQAAVNYWRNDALQKTDSITELGGINGRMLVAHTVTWLLLYLCVFQGVAISGKLAYVTATLPYVCLICFFLYALTLDGAYEGIFGFYLKPDWAKLGELTVWQRASTQIFFSLGIGWGSIVAFGSYAEQTQDFVGHVTKVALINCGTSVFGGFVVFMILGFLSKEMATVNPCFIPGNIAGLEAIGLQGSGLAFVAFPIAISRMYGKFFWAFLFFIMLLALGIGSGFGYLESIVTVLFDSGYTKDRPRWQVAGLTCFACWFLGLIFVTGSGDYWIKLFDTYTTVLSVFLISLTEIAGMMWVNKGTYPAFRHKVLMLTGRELPSVLGPLWAYIGPVYIVILLALSIQSFDLTGNNDVGDNKKFPTAILLLGWLIGLIPVIGASATLFLEPAVLPHRPEEMLELELVEPLADHS